MKPNNDEVICPGCCHQFRAIPVNVQQRIADLERPTPWRIRMKWLITFMAVAAVIGYAILHL